MDGLRLCCCASNLSMGAHRRISSGRFICAARRRFPKAPPSRPTGKQSASAGFPCDEGVVRWFDDTFPTLAQRHQESHQALHRIPAKLAAQQGREFRVAHPQRFRRGPCTSHPASRDPRMRSPNWPPVQGSRSQAFPTSRRNNFSGFGVSTPDVAFWKACTT